MVEGGGEEGVLMGVEQATYTPVLFIHATIRAPTSSWEEALFPAYRSLFDFFHFYARDMFIFIT